MKVVEIDFSQGGWHRIFAGGTQVDSKGRPHDGDALIDRAEALFDAGRYRPPGVLGHPKDGKKQLLKVSGLRKVREKGRTWLDVKFDEVDPFLVEAARSGEINRVSAGFAADGSLDHVAFLGRSEPAVDGLPEIHFFRGEEGGISFVQEITGPTPGDDNLKTFSKGGLVMEIKEFFEGLKEVLGFARAVEPPATPAAPPAVEGEKAFSKADLDKAREEAAAEAREKAAAEFKAAEAKKAAEARTAEFSRRVDKLAEDGKLPPAQKDNVKAWLAAADTGDPIEFSAGGKTVKGTQAEKLLAGLEDGSTAPLFAAFDQGRDPAEFAQEEADVKLGKSIAARVTPAGKEG